MIWNINSFPATREATRRLEKLRPWIQEQARKALAQDPYDQKAKEALHLSGEPLARFALIDEELLPAATANRGNEIPKTAND